MTVPNSLGENQPAAGKIRRSDIETDRYWVSVVTEEPVSHDLKVLVREDLLKAWHFRRDAKHREETRMHWATTDGYRIVLEDLVGRVDIRTSMRLYNKPTAFYCLQSAHTRRMRSLASKILLAGTYEEWRRCHNGTPTIEYGHFFANLVRIAPTGPTTLQGVIKAHLSLCVQASSLAKQVNKRVDSMSFGSSLQPYSLLPLYRSIVVVVDRIDGCGAPTVPEPDRKTNIRMFAQFQTVLIARTGVEDGLSAAISFNGLASESLPLETADIISQDVDVVRVSLSAAVQFIASLEARENSLLPKPEDGSPLDQSLCPYSPNQCGEEGYRCLSPELWADTIMAAAEKHGYDNIFEAWQSIRRVKADLAGEGFCDLEHMPFANHWK
jgi:hypothetical protein